MSLFGQVDKVRAAQAQVHAQRTALAAPAAALLARGRRYPLTTLGLAAGAGFVLGSVALPGLRVPGLAGLLRGGLAGALQQGLHWLGEHLDSAADA